MNFLKNIVIPQIPKWEEAKISDIPSEILLYR